MTTQQNNFEGGGAAGGEGTGITTGNSGGASGNAFNTITIPSGGTFTFSVTGADVAGTFGGRWRLISAGTGWRAYLQWAAVSNQLAARWVFCFNTLPTVNMLIAVIVNGSFTSNMQMLYVTASQTLQTRNAAGTNIGPASSAISANTVYVLEAQMDCSNSNTTGTIQTQLYALANPGVLLLNYASGATVDAGGGAASPQPIRGSLGNNDIVANLDLTFDDLFFVTGTLTPVGAPYTGPVISPPQLVLMRTEVSSRSEGRVVRQLFR